MAAKASARSVNVLCGLGHGPTLAAAVSVPLVIIRHMPTTRGARAVDPVDRAHLTGVTPPSPPIHRYAAGAHLADLVDRYWIPVWSLAEPSTQSTLQHPVCLVVVSNTYARFYGVARGRSSVTLEGDGWAVGTMLHPGGRAAPAGPVGRRRSPTAGSSSTRCCRPAHADGWSTGSARRWRPTPPTRPPTRAAIAAVERRLATHLPVDEQGLLINELVAWLRDHPEVTRVAELAAHVGLTERSLQRLVEQRVGLSPKWLIQRRRLHDAVEALKAGQTRWPTWPPSWATPTRPTSPTTSAPSPA